MTEENETAKEQTRGLYIIGLLAVLITIRLTVTISDPITNMLFIYLITSWTVYSFCMIFAFADIPHYFATFFKELGWLMLRFSLIVSIGYFVLLSLATFALFPDMILWYVVLAIVMIGLHYKKRVQKKKPSENPERNSDKKEIKMSDTLRDTKKEEEVAKTDSVDWKKQIGKLIKLVDCECKRKFFTPRRIAVLACWIGIFIFIVSYLYWMNLTIRDVILSYAKMLPSGNQTQPDGQLRFLVEQLPSFASLSISISALIVAVSSFLLSLLFASLKPFTPEELANYHYGRLSKNVDAKDKPHLKALINMKCRELDISLWENYQNCVRINCNLFSEELLLKSLYQSK